ncbi:MAG: LON peptidase substrate-binding domain-containing protein [bacterium]|nr:LON peptidase substrate-binding domain-containing protein [bacterium]
MKLNGPDIESDETLVVPVFPLPNTVLFPNTVLPLHVFEPRYREMIADATAGDGNVAIALLRPGYEKDYEGSPSFFPVGTIGHIEELTRLPDGRFTFNLVGDRRVEMTEIVSNRSYRLVQCTPLPENPLNEDEEPIQRAKFELMTSHAYLLREISPVHESAIVLDEEMPFEAAVNGCCANLPTEAETRQTLLGLDDLLTRQRKALELNNEVLERVLRYKAPIPDDETGHGRRTMN